MTELLAQHDINSLVFIASGFFGLVAHYVKKRSRNETQANFVAWFTHNNPSASVYTAGAFLFAMIAALNTGIITDASSLVTVAYAGVTTGFAIDSGFNADTPEAK